MEYHVNHQLHNAEGPAEIYYHINGKISDERYWINGKLHNERGPAIVEYHESGAISSVEYYIYGVKIEKVDHHNS